MKKSLGKKTTDMNNHNMVLKRLNSYVISVMDLPELKETHVKLMTLISYHSKKAESIQKRFNKLKAETDSIKAVLNTLSETDAPSYKIDDEQEKIRSKQSQLISLFQERSERDALKKEAQEMIVLIRNRIVTIESDNQKIRERLDLMRLAQGRPLTAVDEMESDRIKEVA